MIIKITININISVFAVVKRFSKALRITVSSDILFKSPVLLSISNDKLRSLKDVEVRTRVPIIYIYYSKRVAILSLSAITSPSLIDIAVMMPGPAMPGPTAVITSSVNTFVITS